MSDNFIQSGLGCDEMMMMCYALEFSKIDWKVEAAAKEAKRARYAEKERAHEARKRSNVQRRLERESSNLRAKPQE